MLMGTGTVSRYRALAAAALLALAGCESRPAVAPPDTGLTSLKGSSVGNTEAAPTTDSEITRMAEQAAHDLETIKSPGTSKNTQAQSAASMPLVIEAAPGTTPPANVETVAKTPTQSQPKSAPEPAESAPPSQAESAELAKLPPRDAAAVELGAAVAKALRVLKDEPGTEQAVGQLVGVLEALQPGFLVGIENKTSPLYQALGATDAAEILRHRQFVTAGATPATTAEPPAPAEPPVRPNLNIADVRLCTRVTSFGRYESMPSDTFVSGKPIRALVYVEIENFGNKELAGDQRLVELSQKLALFKENETRDIWSTHEQTVRESAQRPRRDFYLVQQIDLPRNLSLGSYFLKVTVNDRVTGAQAEKNLPIRVVADDRSASGE